MLRKANLKDMPAMMFMIGQAQAFLSHLQINQWQNGYPSSVIIEQDIQNGNAWVLEDNNTLIALAVVAFAIEPTYLKIYNGSWLTDGDYAVIHRLTVHEQWKGKGIGTLLFEKIETLAKMRNVQSIRVDTHQDNFIMRKLITKSGYQYCGEIFLEDGQPRLGYEKVLTKIFLPQNQEKSTIFATNKIKS